MVLPANLFLPVRAAESGREGDLSKLAEEPRVTAKPITVAVASQGDGSSLRWGRQLWKIGSFARRRGTVEIRPYDSSVVVKSVRIEGRLNQGWWQEWKKRRVAEELP